MTGPAERLSGKKTEETKGKGQRAKGKGQRAKGKGQRAKEVRCEISGKMLIVGLSPFLLPWPFVLFVLRFHEFPESL